MSMSEIPPSPGGHLFAAAFGDASSPSATSTPPAPRRKRTAGVIATVLGVATLGLICAGVQWGANVAYDDARAAFDDAVADASAAQIELGGALAALTATTDAASTVSDADTGNLMDATAREAFLTAVSDASAAETAATALVDQPLPSADEKPSWAWELFGELAHLNSERAATVSSIEDIEAADSDLAEASDALDDAGAAAVVSAAEAAGAFEAAHVSARNLDILALRSAAEWLSGASMMDAPTADAYVDLEAAAVAMLASEQAELAEKEGPLYDARLQIEAFARGLAPGVLLDFDWSPYVNGYGDAGSLGGYATWWYADPGYATIELSNSVAEYWPDDRSKALVAHEVGHAISVKCEGMYDDSTQENIEEWATAWAISMGYADAANGTSAYGAPPQSLVDVAAGCR